MKKSYKAITRLVLTAAAGLLFLASCKTDSDSPYFEYMPDMYRSPAIEPYVDYGEVRERYDENRALTQSAMTPPFGTVPFFGTEKEHVLMMLPYHRLADKGMDMSHGHYGKILSDSAGYEYEMAAKDKNPVRIDADNAKQVLDQGKSLYGKYCQHCHGEKGDGKGPMVESGAYSGVPNYGTLAIADGQMFYSIYYGKGLMGAHASQLNKKEIWTVIHYIRKLQNDKYPAMAEAVEVVQDAMEGESDNK
jgi:mono/diheme cytochrome c family protein